MITFFTTPKAFQGHIGTIQTNAINSWSYLRPKIEVILLGNDEGVKEAAEQFQFKHLPLKNKGVRTHLVIPAKAGIQNTPGSRIARFSKVRPSAFAHSASARKGLTRENLASEMTTGVLPKGVPILSEIFETARSAASHDYLCFINADIILLDDFMPNFEQVSQTFEKFLMVSSRWNLDIETILPLEMRDDRINLRKEAIQKHDMYPAGGSDFFVFRKDMFHQVPPFLLGRGYWDNWLMYQAKQEKATVIDVTADMVAVHQNHDYSHIKGASNDMTVFKAVEGKQNLELAGGQKNIYTNYDADYVLVEGRFYRSWHPKFIFRRLKSSLRRLKLCLVSQK